MNKRGYTLMEVSLFLAISGLLTLVAIVGIGPRLTNVRFSTGMRAIQSNLTKELSSSELGQNNSTKRFACTAVPGSGLSISNSLGEGNNDSSSCVYVGRLVIFTRGSNSITYRPIIAARIPITSTAQCIGLDADSFDYIRYCNQAVILGDNLEAPSTFTYPNGITQSLQSQTYSYGYVRSPNSNTQYHFIATLPFINLITQSPGLGNGFIKYNRVNNVPVDTLPICYTLQNRTARLLMHDSSSNIDTEFNVDLTASCG